MLHMNLYFSFLQNSTKTKKGSTMVPFFTYIQKNKSGYFHQGFKCRSASWMAQSAQCFFFNLSHTLTREIKPHTDFFECERLFVTQAKIQAQNFGFAIVERLEHIFDLFTHRIFYNLFIWSFLRLIGKHVKQTVVVFFAERSIQRPDVSSPHQSILDHFNRYAQFFGDNLRFWLGLTHLAQFTRNFRNIVQQINTVYRQTNNARILGQTR